MDAFVKYAAKKKLAKALAEASDKGGKAPLTKGQLGGAIAAGSLGALGATVAARKGLRVHTADFFKSLFGKGGGRAREMTMGIPKEVQDQATKILSSLRKQGVDPSKVRIGVSGTGGTGKTTLSRALAQQANIKHIKLDVKKSSSMKGGHDAYLTRNKPAPGTVLDQTHLFTQANPDKHFDVLIHLERPTGRIVKDLIKRRRGAHQASLYDYGKLHKDIKTGFESNRAVSKTIQDRRALGGARVRMKIRPKDGWGADDTLNAKLLSMGVGLKDISKMQHVQKVQAATLGRKSYSPFTGPFRYYKNEPFITGALAAGAGGTAAGVYALNKGGKK